MPAKNFSKKILLIDNYDSFTHILGDYLSQNRKNEVFIYYNNEISLAEINKIQPTHIVLSPGPGTPGKKSDFGICQDIILKLQKTTPILGVCLGHQGIIKHLGGEIAKAPLAMHGKTSTIIIKKTKKLKYPNIFTSLPEKFTVMRYHSLIGIKIPSNLQITAETYDQDKIVMAIQHEDYPLYGIQFHPESFLTENGQEIINNFLGIKV